MIDVNSLIGTADVLLVTLDTLRYDAWRGTRALGSRSDAEPCVATILPDEGWEERHSPGSFTYAAHHAFFAGFLPTPVGSGKSPRPFAARFPGSETIGEGTCVLDAPDIVSGLSGRGYHTVCIGGVGFFDKRSPLGSVLPGLFAESHWSPELGVTDPRSIENQVALAASILGRLPSDRRAFLVS